VVIDFHGISTQSYGVSPAIQDHKMLSSHSTQVNASHFNPSSAG